MAAITNIDPKFSIIIPSWNNLPYLQLCIKSIEQHSTHKHQVILYINEGSDGTLDWVKEQGYDHLQQVQAISAYFAEVQEKGGSDDPRLVPLLGCIQQLIPWLKQWHNVIHPEFGYRLGDYFEGFVKDEARTLGLTVEDVQNWEPPKKTKKTRKTKAKTS